MKKVKGQPMYRFLMVLTISSTIGLQVWRTLFNNFAVEVVTLDGNHIGMIQSLREVPGLLTLLVVFVLMIVKEHRLSALSILVLGLGVAVTGLFPSFLGLLFTTLIMSIGFHYYETTNQSLTLQYFQKHTSPWVLGKMRSYSAASNIAVGILIYVLTSVLNYTQMYLLLGSFICATGVWGLRQDPVDRSVPPQHKKMVFRKKYWLFYFLTFMGGARRQIFVAFAIFLLVKNFHFSIQEVTALFVVNNLINYFLSPLIGKSIIRFGERKVLSLEYGSLIFVFLGYAVVKSKIALALLYILDHIFFNFAIAIRTYFQKVADPQDIAPSMAMGFTINHIAAVFLPAVGGLLWMVDYRIPFVAGAAMSMISLLAVQLIRVQPEVSP
ncbi:MAG: MFS transporter [Deltaproteobacteria bacterium]|nr:MFS transporter [Deltaproteobacteria bacterium]